MVKSVIIVVFSVLVFNINAFAQWTSANLSQARQNIAATSWGDQIYFGGGITKSAYSDIVDIYNKTNNLWTSSTLSQARDKLVAVSSNNRVYFAGGFNGASSSIVDIYDVSSGTWSTDNLSEARFGLAAIVAGTRIFFAGGAINYNGAFSNRIDMYDTSTDEWSTATLSHARTNLAVASIGTKVFFAGGFGSTGYSNIVDVYDGDLNLWTTTTLSESRESVAAAAIGSKVFFAGGSNIGGPTDVIDVFDNSTGTWSLLKLSSKRSSISAAVIAEEILFAGGSGSGGTGFSKVVDIYNNTLNSWTISELSVGRSNMATASLDLKAYFAGGIYDISLGYTDLIDIYEFTCFSTELPMFSINASEEICKGSSISLIASGDYTYTWSPAKGLSNTNGSQVTASPETTTIYTVTAIAANNCMASKKVEVIVKPLPELIVQAKDICSGSSTILAASGATTYSWTPPTGLSEVSGSNITASPMETTTYTVIGTDLNNCKSTNNVTINVKQVPMKPIITASNVSLTTILLISSSTQGNQWFRNGELIIGATSQILPVISDGFYTVQVTIDGCASPLADGYNNVITGLEETFTKSKNWLYPNPYNGLLFVNMLNFNPNEEIEIMIFDSIGKMVKYKRMPLGNNSIDSGELPTGNYTVIAKQGKFIQAERVVKN